VGKISIIPRGVAALGYTRQLPTEDRYLLTRAELLDRMDVLLGGRVAEEIVFGDISTGAQDDLQHATDLARDMVTRYGMSESLGPVTFEEPRHALFLDVPSFARKEYSEATARMIDAEIRKLVESAHARVRDTLTSRRDALEALARLLIEKEVVDRETLSQLLGGTNRGAAGAQVG
jgi:cell division protease FtsH